MYWSRYKRYWSDQLLALLWAERLENRARHSTVKELSAQTHILESDITATLQTLNLLALWRGQYIVSVDERLLPGYAQQLEADMKKRQQGVPAYTFKPQLLRYTPLTERGGSASDAGSGVCGPGGGGGGGGGEGDTL